MEKSISVVVFAKNIRYGFVYRQCKKNNVDISTPTRRSSERHHPIVRFFRGPFYRLLTHRILRVGLLTICAGMVALFTVFAAQITPDEQSVG
jgi:hypothetical protein